MLVPELAPTAANVFVSGRVASPNGTGVSGATVSITNAQGTSRTVRTNSFGYFRFENVTAGETYVLGVKAKQYRFAPQALWISDNVSDLVLTLSE